jgi:hypothetical protein
MHFPSLANRVSGEKLYGLAGNTCITTVRKTALDPAGLVTDELPSPELLRK